MAQLERIFPDEEERLFGKFAFIQRLAPTEPQECAAVLISASRIDPSVRIAHRIVGLFRLPRRVIFDFAIIQIVKGEGIIEVGRDEFRFGAGDLFVIPPFVPHRVESDAPHACEHVAVHFDLNSNAPPFCMPPSGRTPYEVLFEPPVALPRRLRLLHGDPAATALEDLLKFWNGVGALRLLMVKTRLLFLLSLLLHRGSSPQGGTDGGEDNDPRISKAIEHLHEHPDEPIQLARLLGLTRLSSTQFHILFKRRTGLTPSIYLLQVRVRRATALLTTNTLLIKEVAAATGFNDPFHFSRVFRRFTGLSPQQYRNHYFGGVTDENNDFP